MINDWQKLSLTGPQLCKSVLLSVAQHKMERIMLGITLRDHKCNTWIRHQTDVNDIIDVIKKGIQGWAGHMVRLKRTTDGQKE